VPRGTGLDAGFPRPGLRTLRRRRPLDRGHRGYLASDGACWIS